MSNYSLDATIRTEQGKGASRRLRRQGLVPAIIYGTKKPAISITLKHNELIRNLEEEAFYAQPITVKFDDKQEMTILRDLQRHPSKPVILHLDLQRINENEAIRIHVPLHYINVDSSIGVKKQGGSVNRILTSVEVICLPKNLPEFITADLVNLKKSDSLHLSDLQLPEGVELPSTGANLAIAAIY